ncbi:protein boule-like [Eucyclogobius newberryi]|uniref:protein boule-like n=1 Tax=Eucyclogobius newberryi TaxID=166745 RepID=UPI003B5C6E8A
MDVDAKLSITSTGASPVPSNCPTPEVPPSENHSSRSHSLDNHSPRNGSVIPNRIFVSGFDHKVSESDLRDIFSQYGTVSKVNIVNNKPNITKCYGFVTFENPEDARNLLLGVNGIYFKDGLLRIRQAVLKHRGSSYFRRPMFYVEPVPRPCGAVYQTSHSGFPYTFHNGLASFPSSRLSPNLHHWTPQPAPVMEPQPYGPVDYQPVYHRHQPQYFINHYQCNSVESSVSSGPVMYAQPEYLHHVPDGILAYQPPMDNSNESHVYSSFPVPPLPAVAAYSYFRESCALAEPEPHGPQTVLQ